jgi:hypothetical protein
MRQTSQRKRPAEDEADGGEWAEVRRQGLSWPSAQGGLLHGENRGGAGWTWGAELSTCWVPRAAGLNKGQENQDNTSCWDRRVNFSGHQVSPLPCAMELCFFVA